MNKLTHDYDCFLFRCVHLVVGCYRTVAYHVRRRALVGGGIDYVIFWISKIRSLFFVSPSSLWWGVGCLISLRTKNKSTVRYYRHKLASL
jgi:hypothetical protein